MTFSSTHAGRRRAERRHATLDVVVSAFCVTGVLKLLQDGPCSAPSPRRQWRTAIGGGIAGDSARGGRVLAVFASQLDTSHPCSPGPTWAVLADGPSTLLVAAARAHCFGWRLVALWRHWQAPVPARSASV